jgi:hypothetical protein
MEMHIAGCLLESIFRLTLGHVCSGYNFNKTIYGSRYKWFVQFADEWKSWETWQG